MLQEQTTHLVRSSPALCNGELGGTTSLHALHDNCSQLSAEWAQRARAAGLHFHEISGESDVVDQRAAMVATPTYDGEAWLSGAREASSARADPTDPTEPHRSH